MPIRVGIVGLSASPMAWVTRAHLGPIKDSPHYELVALATSSPESATLAAKKHGVAPEKAYSSAEDLANDPDVDLVVVSVKVSSASFGLRRSCRPFPQLPDHKAAVVPALKAGKDVFVETPLGNGVAEAEEMAALAKEKGVKTIVGYQSRFVPAVLKVTAMIRHRRID